MVVGRKCGPSCNPRCLVQRLKITPDSSIGAHNERLIGSSQEDLLFSASVHFRLDVSLYPNR